MKTRTVLENNKWQIKVYSPPREHGSPHVHIISKGDNAEVKIYLETLEVSGKTRFSKKSVKGIIRYVYRNYDLLMNQWEVLHGKKK
ncbi:MAG: DUF4160 domain-containing protein [Bacteriovoracaceae bacterium]|nr:DUF4160 domain-containing protein [Bacteriovoracaceae bacterium]